MIIWLSSYPRSGNTFARMLMFNVFGLPSVNEYGTHGDKAFIANGKIFDAMGGVAMDPVSDEFLEEARRDERLWLVKTHERPIGRDPAIYLLRDGRSSIVSYHHYIQDVEDTPCRLEDVIRGNVYAGSWSEHVYDWAPERRERTLLIRFEDLVFRTEREIERISQFLVIPPIAPLALTFEKLHETMPAFFRSGADQQNLRELEASGCEDLFWRWHTPMMERFGYA